MKLADIFDGLGDNQRAALEEVMELLTTGKLSDRPDLDSLNISSIIPMCALRLACVEADEQEVPPSIVLGMWAGTFMETEREVMVREMMSDPRIALMLHLLGDKADD